MMNRRILIVGLFLLGMLLIPTLVKTVRAVLNIQEMPLNPSGAPSEIHADSQGNLWISDFDAGEIWSVNSTGTGYTSYSVGGNSSDARPDNLGGVWWVDMTSINRLDIATADIQAWDVIGSGRLYGLSIDNLGRVWMADSGFSLPNVYRFNPANRELCTYPLPDGGQGYYPDASGSQVWLGDTVNGRLLRLGSTQIDWWDLPTGSFPQDVDIDETGNVWYADANLNQIGRLVPGTAMLTVFGLPVGDSPAMLSTSAGKVWYTEILQATVGLLDPLLAAGSSQQAMTGSVGVTPGCITLASATTGKAKTTNGVPGWSTASYSTLTDTGGWRIYQLPDNSFPQGIAVTDFAWMVDSGRRMLVKLPFSNDGETTYHIFLPIILR